ncbi:hypothetical protein TNCV_3951151 [Trichonephila clavipes]|nr:hypothetical protein TNCV_3951151 [Trichonephila clavipes]
MTWLVCASIFNGLVAFESWIDGTPTAVREGCGSLCTVRGTNEGGKFRSEYLPFRTQVLYPPRQNDRLCVIIFPELAHRLQDRRFQSAEEVKRASQVELKNMAKNGFQKCFEDLYKRWNKCVVAQGSYFEGWCVSAI